MDLTAGRIRTCLKIARYCPTRAAGCAACTAPAAFTMRREPPSGSAVCTNNWTNWAFVKFGWTAKRRAATPAAIGEANDVPLQYPYPPPIEVVRILTPGAASVIQSPKFEKVARWLVGSVAATATVALQAAG